MTRAGGSPAERVARVYAYDAALHRTVTGVNGFIYQGDRLNAIVDALAYLRANPEDAAALLDPEFYEAWNASTADELEAIRG